MTSPWITMLGFQYVVAKSRALSSALDRELSVFSTRSSSCPSASDASDAGIPASTDASVASHASTTVRNEGHAFLALQHARLAPSVSNHEQLLESGHTLDAALSQTRAKLQAEAESEQCIAQQFHLVSSVRHELVHARELVVRVVHEVEEVEKLLLRRWEEKEAQRNAAFALKVQEELEVLEASIAQASEGRKNEVIAQRRERLERVVRNDLRTYQTVKAEQRETQGREMSDEKHDETLEQVDLVVTADPDQLAAFYESEEEEEEEEERTDGIPKEVLVMEEEKSEEKERQREVGKGAKVD
ncbi:hypothetical protein PsorP6_015397 [Peronosclerospora sorghi]|uniref:Uncharacterized protein n=1 Tax=Peronosclerospora sorghi TaxID=230839 RepID=A0ACC0WQ50_9STRA|nr:hypothetical protein PsorP6_015397 [Peronosclerospora sorghi]